jgi:hypothetical protein
MIMNPQRKRKVTLTVKMLILPAKERRQIMEATESKTFQLSQCAWDLLTVWNKGTDKTSTRIHTVVFVGRRS